MRFDYFSFAQFFKTLKDFLCFLFCQFFWGLSPVLCPSPAFALSIPDAICTTCLSTFLPRTCAFFGMYSNGIGLAQMSSGSPLLPSPMARCCITSGKDSGASERPCANATTLTVRNERPQTSASLSFRDEPCCVALALDADEQPSNWGGGMQF